MSHLSSTVNSEIDTRAVEWLYISMIRLVLTRKPKLNEGYRHALRWKDTHPRSYMPVTMRSPHAFAGQGKMSKSERCFRRSQQRTAIFARSNPIYIALCIRCMHQQVTRRSARNDSLKEQRNIANPENPTLVSV